MDKLQLGQINQQLNKTVSFGVGLMSYRDFFVNHVSRVTFIESDNMDKYNRVKFNRMDNNKEQDNYMTKLKSPIIKYRAYLINSDSFISINKTLFKGFKLLNNDSTINLNAGV